METLTREMIGYWDRRAPSYTEVIRKNLEGVWERRWADMLISRFPAEGDAPLRILDIGTGPGFYAIILAERGYRVWAVDYAENMLAEARRNAGALAERIDFRQMDAHRLDFPANSFDAVVTRNLTWTLPEPEKAYREWFRLLRKGGVLLNFDAAYADNVRNQNQSASRISPSGVYGHVGVTPELARENAEITLAMPAGGHERPRWDGELARRIGFSS